MAKLTLKELRDMKKDPNHRKLIAVNTGEMFVAAAAAEAGVDYIGFGMDRPVDMAVPELREVRRVVPDTLICTPLFKESSISSDEAALRDAVRLLENGADVIYCTGMPIERIKLLTKHHIPCVGHLGLKPYFASWTGGFRAVGKTVEQAEEVFEEAMELNEAGVFFAEVECVPHQLADYITKKVDFITLSMGSGAGCDAQFLFACDLLGATNVHYPRHSKKYDDFYGRSVEVFRQFIVESSTGVYPASEHMIEMPEHTYKEFFSKHSF